MNRDSVSANYSDSKELLKTSLFQLLISSFPPTVYSRFKTKFKDVNQWEKGLKRLVWLHN